MRKFTRAILRAPARSFIDALAQSPNYNKPNYERAFAEHQRYAKALEQMGVKTTICPADERFPDGNFVEDTHLVLAHHAVIELNPGAPSRANEPMSLSSYLPQDYKKMVLSKKYTIDGGDILEDGNKLYIGISTRTQYEAYKELADIASTFAYEVHALEVPYGLHLKSGMTAMLENHFIIQEGFIDIVKKLQKDNNSIDYFVVPPEEDFAANVLPINGKIMMPSGCPQTKGYISQFYAKEDIYDVDTQQVRLVDGALTCGCLLFV